MNWPESKHSCSTRRGVSLRVSIGIAVAGLGLAFSAVHASGGYRLPISLVSGGGGTSSGGAYTLTLSMGQPIAGNSSGGSYLLMVGYPSQQVAFRIYLPVVFPLSSG